jgi:hypothetical protein
MKRIVRITKNVSIISLITLIMLEFLLWNIDPLGVMTERYWIEFVNKYRYEHPTGYAIQPGEYQIRGNTVTIDSAGNRQLPARYSNCTIAFIGDSFTFGWGVSDNEAFPHLIAEMRPEVQFINTAKPGYNAVNLQRSFEHWSADAYIYTGNYNDLVHNTAYPNASYMPQIEHLALRAYSSFMHRQQRQKNDVPTQTEKKRYDKMLSTIESMDNVLVAFTDQHTAQVASRRLNGIIIMPDVTTISIADGHPDVAGHEIYAQKFLPQVDQLISENCQRDNTNYSR